ncbi:MAG: radical SAM family heme chaperone HemW [Brevinema sp.]
MNLSRIYLHYPFCTKLCHYCNFVAGVAPLEHFMQFYHKALIKEISYYQQNYHSLKSFYFGGGTPSLMPIDFLETIFSFFSFNSDTEITLEINPETVTKEKAKYWFELGINRVSLGWQSMEDSVLKFLGRTSTSRDNIMAFEILREVGFTNISVDRILSVRGDNDASFFRAVERCKPDHISSYQLSIEEKTVLSLWTKQQKYLPIAENKALAKEIHTQEFLQSLGFHRYETSSYAQVGKEGKHNIGYWDYDYWLGLGVGAFGFLPRGEYGFHYQNNSSFQYYCKEPCQYEESEYPDLRTAVKEMLMLGLRKSSGINKKYLERRLNVSWEKLFEDCPNTDYFLNQEDVLILKPEMIPLTNPAILDLWDSLSLDI